jgi:hypothetical protein
MSTSKLDTSGAFQPVTVQGLQTRLTLPNHAVRIRKNGIEFCSADPIQVWTEMTVDLHSPSDNKKLKCTGVVVASKGDRHNGYTVSMVFMNLSRQSQEHLSFLAFSQMS